MSNDKKNKAEQEIKQAKIIKLPKDKSSKPLDHLLKNLEKINDDLEAHWKQETAQDESTEEDDDLSNSKDSNYSY